MLGWPLNVFPHPVSPCQIVVLLNDHGLSWSDELDTTSVNTSLAVVASLRRAWDAARLMVCVFMEIFAACARVAVRELRPTAPCCRGRFAPRRCSPRQPQAQGAGATQACADSGGRRATTLSSPRFMLEAIRARLRDRPLVLGPRGAPALGPGFAPLKQAWDFGGKTEKAWAIPAPCFRVRPTALANPELLIYTSVG
jgi:hypothetical protein